MRRLHTFLLGAVACASLLSAAGCHDPYAEVRAGLGQADRDRFDRGARVAAPCAACHDMAGTTRKIGPHLMGLIGRRAGGVDHFAYSPAFERSDVIWDAGNLDFFLAQPQRLVPGNRMISPGVLDSTSRSDLVYFLLVATARDQ